LSFCLVCLFSIGWEMTRRDHWAYREQLVG
jgi:hypothetical protein